MAAWIAAGAVNLAAQATPSTSAHVLNGPWQTQHSGTHASLRGIHAVSDRIAWASGSHGTVLRTLDGGATWTQCAVPEDAEKSDFRSVWAWSADMALIVSAGPGYQSRVYKTTDGCKTWKLRAYSPEMNGFWDGVVFLTSKIGFLLGDPVNGHWDVRTTTDGGDTWDAEGDPGLEADAKSEGAFAASNSAITALGPNLWFGSGGTGGAAVHRSVEDCSRKDASGQCLIAWEKVSVPMAGGSAAAGVFSVGARPVPALRNIAVVAAGGNYEKPNDTTGIAAYSLDAGKTWKPTELPPHGYRSAVEWDRDRGVWITVGTNGSDVSRDNGKTWSPVDDNSWNALGLPWVVGPDGAIAKLPPGALK